MTTWRSRIVDSGEEDPEQLLANPRNWRIHPKAQQDALGAVLQEVGWVQQVIVNRTTGYVVDGHLRVALALSRSEPMVPVVYVELTPEEEALVLASLDPLAGMAVTDEAQLDALLAGITVEDEALAALLGIEEKGGLTDPDEVPEPPAEPITKPGDLWLLGEHRLLCGDSADTGAMDRLCLEEIGCVLTDPPYGIDLDTDYTAMQGSKKLQNMRAAKGEPRRVKANAYRKVEGDAVPFDASVLASRFGNVKEQFWFGANYYRRSLSVSDLDGSWLVWDKRKDNLDTVIGSGFELIWSKTAHKQDVLRYLWSGFTARNQDMDRAHPTEKPVALLGELLTRWAPAGCVVADPFGGSGTTLIAAEQTGRSAYLMEIDPAYCDVIVTRWESFTGKEAQRG